MSLPPLHTVHPEHIRSLASLPPRYTVHPEHKKAPYLVKNRGLIFPDIGSAQHQDTHNCFSCR